MEELKNRAGADFSAKSGAVDGASVPVPSDAAARVKKLRSRLGVIHSTNFTCHADSGETVSYGDGHSGWNR